jgi:hypothetical protein
MAQFKNQGWIERPLIHFSTTYNKLTMGIRGEFRSGEVEKYPIITILFKIKNASIFVTLWILFGKSK